MPVRIARRPFSPSLAVLLAVALLLPACSSSRSLVEPPPAGPNYSRPLPPGRSALRLVVESHRMPDLGAAWAGRDAVLVEQMDRSLAWFEKPSSRDHFPFEGISHDRARASVAAMKDLMATSDSAGGFASAVRDRFDVYESIGCDDAGTVLFTGYYAPEFPASRTPSSRFVAPLYRRPADLVTDTKSGEPLGRKDASGNFVPYWTRAEIEREGLLDGGELIWLEDRLSAYLIHVNGSARLRLEDGTVVHVGYDGKTDRPYSSLGRAMIREGLLPADRTSVPMIRRVWREKPAEVEALMLENDSFVFFAEYEGDKWPAGSLGFRVGAEASLATDKKIYPRGGVVMVDTHLASFSGTPRPFQRLMLDQDTGGAIKAPGRADIFLGVGETAGLLAGQQYAEGKLYYFFLKPEFMPMPAAAAASAASAATGR